jgi:hypothetical protein
MKTIFNRTGLLYALLLSGMLLAGGTKAGSSLVSLVIPVLSCQHTSLQQQQIPAQINYTVHTNTVEGGPVINSEEIATHSFQETQRAFRQQPDGVLIRKAHVPFLESKTYLSISSRTEASAETAEGTLAIHLAASSR